jgi:hypothetical protein
MEINTNYENRTEKIPTDASLICCSIREPINSMSLENAENISDNSKFFFHCGSEFNIENKFSDVRMSDNRIFVLDINGKPLTPCKPQKARKLLVGKVAQPVWNKFGEFGIQMQIPTRKFVPEFVLGQDWGTKFEGYSVVSGEQNNLNVMLKLPDKKKLVKKLEERRRLRKARRFRNCRRRACRFDNRLRGKNWLAPSQLQIVNSRLKIIREILKSYPIQKIAIEDVKFNHRDKKWGKNFSTMEVGKKKIFDYLREQLGVSNVLRFEGFETQEAREKRGLKKSSNKSSETFNSHCVDSFVLASELLPNKTIPNRDIIFVDDNYRAIRRKLHDTQPNKKGIRQKFSSGSFKGIQKGCICEFGQIVGGTKNYVYYCDFEKQDNGRKIYQKVKMLNKIKWLSHNYKTKKINGENEGN